MFYIFFFAEKDIASGEYLLLTAVLCGTQKDFKGNA